MAPLFSTIASAILCLALLIGHKKAYGDGCYRSVISFGDSLADTGNLLHMRPPGTPIQSGRWPYGKTFFHHPTGRFSDGRLIIDFIAQSLGLPFLEPFIDQVKNANTSSRDFSKGVNFAVGGATALDVSFLEKYGIFNPLTNISLSTQLDWFKEYFAIFCQANSDCKTFLQTSLIIVGEIGGNEYNYAFVQGANREVIESFVIAIIGNISFTIQELIKLGARTVMVPGNLPIGCLPYYLSYYENSEEKEYDPKTGCLNWLNRFSEYHNELLQKELNRLRGLYPHATITYGDYYNAAMRLYLSPIKYGFTSVLRACCGGGGPYNFNASAWCSYLSSTDCDDPSKYVSWDGIHFTEAAYRWIAQGLFEGPYTNPPIRTVCSSISRTYELSEY
ncbi:GDSL esterase lipase At1g28590-like [Olea europaea subsp. europaea]|uniref:GDSL esterase lipase At1g28590-like n=1 Tax=Olea europaea subsp. europaea TaxID=158383 RepID=A0A8S0Q034_OLEEU|nr:GDSL esterase lipase At1g28590-like [Olea europaea subsp. europaea]